MPKLEIEDLFTVMNMIVPDCAQLGVANMYYEVSNGKLLNDDPEGARAAEAPDAKLLAFYAYIDLNGQGYHSARVFDTADDTDEILARLGERIEALPEEPADERTRPVQLTNFPSTYAAMVAWQRADGTVWYVTYRHTDMPPLRAHTILKNVFRTITERRQERADNGN